MIAPDESVIAARLRDRIMQGDWTAGQPLPSQGAIADEFGVSRHTVRRALSRLSALGLIERAQGTVARVRQPLVQFDLNQKTRFSEFFENLGRHGEAEMLSFRRRRPPGPVVQAMGIGRVETVWTVTLLRRVDGRPFSLASHYFVPGLPVAPFSARDCRSITRILAESGHGDYRRQHTTIGARMPSAREAALLGMRPPRPVITTTGCNVSARGEPLEISETVFPGDFVRFSVRH